MLAEAERTDTIIYLDEAHEYADESLEILLNQGRKYSAGVVIAHQFLDQLNPHTCQTLLANASVKILGGLSHKGNQSFEREMGTDIPFLASLHKKESGTEFGLWVKNQIPHALRLSAPFGLLESAVRLNKDGEHYQRLVNRSNYCTRAVPVLENTYPPETEATKPPHATSRSGRYPTPQNPANAKGSHMITVSAYRLKQPAHRVTGPLMS